LQAALDRVLRTNYTVLGLHDVITFQADGMTHAVQVEALQPEGTLAASVVDTDLTVEFEAMREGEDGSRLATHIVTAAAGFSSPVGLPAVVAVDTPVEG
jgi:hypothetical protein